MKKVSLLGFILTATVPHLASANAGVEGPAVAVQAGGPCCPKAFQGFGLKGILGYGVGVGKQKSFIDRRASASAGGAVISRARSRTDIGYNGVDGGVGVDWTQRLCNWAVGIGFDATWAGTSGNRRADFFEAATATTAAEAGVQHSKVRLKNSLQLYGKLGYVMREIAMPFVALGWDNSQWKQNTQFATAAQAAVAASAALPGGLSPVAATRAHAHKSKRFNAFLWKAGVDFLATKHVVLGLEYTGTIAGRKKGHRTFTDRTGTITRVGTSFKPQYNKFALTAKIVY